MIGMKLSFSLGSMLGVGGVGMCVEHIARHGRDGGGGGEVPDAIWIPETWGMECFAMLADAAARTRTARIGSSIINTYSRSPALIGMGAVTVDALSGGRMVLGLGTGSAPIVEDLHGYAFERPLARMREYVEIVRMVTAGGGGSGRRIDHDGEFFKLRGFTPLVRPLRERIPVYMAAVNRRMVDLAWEVADGVIMYLRPRPEMAGTIRTMRSKKGARRGVEVACQVITAVSDDAERAADRARRTLAFYVAVGRTYRDFLAANGYGREAQAVADEYARSGLGGVHECIPDAMLRDLTICGTPQEARAQLDGFAGAGVDLPILQFNPVGDDVRGSFAVAYDAFCGAQ